MTQPSPGLRQVDFEHDALLTGSSEAAWERRISPGGEFVLDAPEAVPAVWGDGDSVAWAEGEAMWIAAPASTGKTTIASQLVRARLGLQGELLGMAVKADERKVLYLALDRPRQIARAMRRSFSEEDRERLEALLEVWAGPLPFNVASDPERLAALAVSRGAGTLIIDSAKDAAMELSKDETGSNFNRAIQLVLAAGIEVLVLHHQRKASAQNPKPRKLSDVYGSTWLTAGAGSVLLLWGEPGDPIVELRTLKPAVGEIGPLMVEHDHVRGISTVHESPDLLELARSSPSGITVTEAAISLYGPKPAKADRERARRRLVAMTRGREPQLKRVEGETPRFVAVPLRATPRDPHTNARTEGTPPLEQAARNGSRGYTEPSLLTVAPFRGDVSEGVPPEVEPLGVALYDDDEAGS